MKLSCVYEVMTDIIATMEERKTNLVDSYNMDEETLKEEPDRKDDKWFMKCHEAEASKIEAYNKILSSMPEFLGKIKF